MQCLLHPKRCDAVARTTLTVERREFDVRDPKPRFGKALDEDVKIGVILALVPPSVQNHCHLTSHIFKSYPQVRTLICDYWWMLGKVEKKGKGGGGKTAKGTCGDGKDDKKGTGMNRNGKGKSQRQSD